MAAGSSANCDRFGLLASSDCPTGLPPARRLTAPRRAEAKSNGESAEAASIKAHIVVLDGTRDTERLMLLK